MLPVSAVCEVFSMGKVYVTLEIGPSNDRVAPVKFMVDTESLYTFISPELADQLGVDFFATNLAQLPGGTQADIPVGFAYIKIQDRDGATLVSTTDAAEPRLGSAALQALGLEVNYKQDTVEFTGLYPKKV